jgi:hypothetical protein
MEYSASLAEIILEVSLALDTVWESYRAFCKLRSSAQQPASTSLMFEAMSCLDFVVNHQWSEFQLVIGKMTADTYLCAPDVFRWVQHLSSAPTTCLLARHSLLMVGCRACVAKFWTYFS